MNSKISSEKNNKQKAWIHKKLILAHLYSGIWFYNYAHSKMLNVRINGKVNLNPHFEQEERTAMMTQKYQAKLDAKQLKKSKNDPYETIKIIQKNLISDFDEIIAEKRIYAYLMHTDIKSPLYHIEKLSELIGKAKAIIKSKVYKIDRRTALQKAIDLFNRVKDRLSSGLLDDLKNSSYKRQISETPSQYENSPQLERNFSAQEVFSRHIQDSIYLNRQRLGNDDPDNLSEPSQKSVSDSGDEKDYCENVWSRNQPSSTSTHSCQSMQDNNYDPWKNYGSTQNVCHATPCISPPLPTVTPLYTNHKSIISATPCISPPLPRVTPLCSNWNVPRMPQKSSFSEKSTLYDDLFYGHAPTPNVNSDEIESIQATLEGLGNFENYDGKSSNSNEDSDSGTKHYYYVDGELSEFKHPKNKPNQSIDSTEASKSGSDDWNILKLTQENLAKFEKAFNPIKKLADQKVEATKRKIDEVDNKKIDNRIPKKTKTEPKKVKKIKLIREKKLYVKESPEIYKILKKYKK
ncbi:hypothetical protein ACKWTF_004472 [Chironomus riparius]